jgi:hypothetical protein
VKEDAMGRWKEFTDGSVQQLWLDYCGKKMEVETLQEVNAELVEALKLAREEAVGWYDDSRGFDFENPPEWLKPIDAALAKATGEQQ